MKRFAAHYIFISPDQVYKLHFLELDDNNCIKGVFPLASETANTSFYNGILFPIKTDLVIESFSILHQIKKLQKQNPKATIFDLLSQLEIVETRNDKPVSVVRLDGIDLLSSKLGASDSGSDCHIQRLC